ncbi:hypothetical protein COLO4_10595 [Corchorus olitorius]|uniref:Uncharacterized protein n=1 Tax=Corchorus olitorius TaxID=93759 RepID=A0A1R3K7V4_9ROSI|nr:hypothetical protein COLO4_10595 [Corchorus olitorius]
MASFPSFTTPPFPLQSLSASISTAATTSDQSPNRNPKARNFHPNSQSPIQKDPEPNAKSQLPMRKDYDPIGTHRQTLRFQPFPMSLDATLNKYGSR